jgi:YegS C-terminal NAD kinase beta sandwich-like domain
VTVRRGSPWGEPTPLPDGAVVVAGDREIAGWLAATEGDEPPVFALTGGDLHRTLGGPLGTPRWERGEAQRFPIDVLDVRLDGTHHVAVAHVVAHGRLGWLSQTVVALNAAFVGTDYLGPRAHPNDGLVDVTEGRLPLSDLWAARRRFESGSHLPHPSLRESRVPSYEIELARPIVVALDGRPVGRFRQISVDVRPDAISVVL